MINTLHLSDYYIRKKTITLNDIGEGYNLNTLVDIGYYFFEYIYDVTPLPANVNTNYIDGFGLMVVPIENASQDYCLQVFIVKDDEIYIRTGYSGDHNWSEWRKIAMKDEIIDEIGDSLKFIADNLNDLNWS